MILHFWDLRPTRRFHWDGIVGWQHSQLSNGLLAGTNSLIQAAKRRARGYRSKTKMITVIYLIAGKLPQPQVHTIQRGAGPSPRCSVCCSHSRSWPASYRRCDGSRLQVPSGAGRHRRDRRAAGLRIVAAVGRILSVLPLHRRRAWAHRPPDAPPRRLTRVRVPAVPTWLRPGRSAVVDTHQPYRRARTIGSGDTSYLMRRLPSVRRS